MIAVSAIPCISSACLALTLAAAQAAPAELSPFGIGADHQTGQNLTSWIPQMAAIGIRTMRSCTPAQREYLTDLKMDFGELLYEVPPGDKLDAPGTLPVKDLDAWSRFVTDEVRQANGAVKYWEVWNEPPNGIGHGQTASDYARLLVRTYDAAKQADPGALIGMAAKSVDVNWLEQTIKAGGKDHFDSIVLHPYEALGCAVDHPGAEAVFMSIVPTVRKMLALQDPGKAGVPIIFTELGYDAGRGPGLQAEALVKAYAMGIAQGVTCIDWFEGIDGDSGPMGLLEADGRPRPAYTAMAQMLKYLGEHPAYLGWVLLNARDYGFIFQGPIGPVLIAWAPKGAPDYYDFAATVSVVNPLTGLAAKASACALTEGPVIVEGPPAGLVKQAESNRANPFPWGGDYTHAKSVSVTFGRTNVERGLHTQSASTIAADVIAYGGSAREGAVPGGAVFMVDPNFLSYDQAPIEISVVVRRNAANQNAGFKLTYESTTGYKDRGWYTVPDNKEWHTMKWKITDPEFVNMWGYSFSLVSDSDQYAHYYIQSVTVTRLDR